MISTDIFNKILKNFPITIAFLYIVGFVSWNHFLAQYAFFEYNLLQTRFLSAGISFFVLLIVSLLLFFSITFFYTKESNKAVQATKSILPFVCVVLLILFPLVFFSKIPQYFGGAAPSPVAIIGTEEQINYLLNFNVPEQEDSKIQTGLVCQLYQNKEIIILGTHDKASRARVLILRKNDILGISVIPKKETKNFTKTICKKFFVNEF